MQSKLGNHVVSLALILILIACCSIAIVTSNAPKANGLSTTFPPRQSALQSNTSATAKPHPAPARWLGLIGEYGPDDDIVVILEKDGKLWASFKRAEPEPLDEIASNVFKFPSLGAHALQQLIFERNRRSRATQVAVDAVILKRRQIEPESGNQLRVNLCVRFRS